MMRQFTLCFATCLLFSTPAFGEEHRVKDSAVRTNTVKRSIPPRRGNRAIFNNRTFSPSLPYFQIELLKPSPFACWPSNVLDFEMSNCALQLKLPDELKGKRIRCSGCKTEISTKTQPQQPTAPTQPARRSSSEGKRKVICNRCKTKLSVPSSVSEYFKCPKCSKSLRIAKPATNVSRPNQQPKQSATNRPNRRQHGVVFEILLGLDRTRRLHAL